ncbi:MAG: SIMPL domain-containing protein [Alphaproteobacteria bacterium]|nr:SIMPL domain-containing protein [Alphaproteobacteria bacterium]
MIFYRSIAFIFALAIAPAAAFAQTSDADKPGIVSVTGEGIARLAPDMALVTMSVLRQEKTARAALDANNRAMTEVLAAMKQNGIETRDLQTSNFSIDPQYFYPKSTDNKPVEPQITGYRVSNTLTVRVRDLSKLGTILDTSVTLGVNQGGNIQFTNDDPSAAIDEARKDAMLNAIAKAKTLTEAAGIGLGPIAMISEQHRTPSPVPLMRAEMAMKASADAAVPVASGENQYSVTVNVNFELKQ